MSGDAMSASGTLPTGAGLPGVVPAGGPPIRVVIVDDDALVRAGLAMLLGGGHGLEVVGEAADGLAAGTVIARTAPDVVLMDIRMPVCDGITATAREVARRPDLPVIVLTTFDADELVLGALRAGARGFLLKDTPPVDLVHAVRQVAVGRSILSPSVLDTVIGVAAQRDRADRTAERERFQTLTEREQEVALAIARGWSNARIAADLYLGVATVKTHVGHVLDKLGVEGRVQVAVLVHEAGLAPSG
ncbi:response regulator [Clavibacter michiganensis]|uniref:response regulator n=1 Tax=Clavibacter michiganensis TaxID=28447 RepID=UPI001303254A|nr:response regulator transcription factor [Clavibacter michiganensis]MWJ12754.1 DNA-binding response regulator [Clavibacter michiganensis subsp. michiganensis]MWJ46975.1 DNA-binding response regulator [Clavibacter michiganensis subsp. michiganensis]